MKPGRGILNEENSSDTEWLTVALKNFLSFYAPLNPTRETIMMRVVFMLYAAATLKSLACNETFDMELIHHRVMAVIDAWEFEA